MQNSGADRLAISPIQFELDEPGHQVTPVVARVKPVSTKELEVVEHSIQTVLKKDISESPHST